MAHGDGVGAARCLALLLCPFLAAFDRLRPRFGRAASSRADAKGSLSKQASRTRLPAAAASAPHRFYHTSSLSLSIFTQRRRRPRSPRLSLTPHRWYLNFSPLLSLKLCISRRDLPACSTRPATSSALIRRRPCRRRPQLLVAAAASPLLLLLPLSPTLPFNIIVRLNTTASHHIATVTATSTTTLLP